VLYLFFLISLCVFGHICVTLIQLQHECFWWNFLYTICVASYHIGCLQWCLYCLSVNWKWPRNLLYLLLRQFALHMNMYAYFKCRSGDAVIILQHRAPIIQTTLPVVWNDVNFSNVYKAQVSQKMCWVITSPIFIFLVIYVSHTYSCNIMFLMKFLVLYIHGIVRCWLSLMASLMSVYVNWNWQRNLTDLLLYLFSLHMHIYAYFKHRSRGECDNSLASCT